MSTELSPNSTPNSLRKKRNFKGLKLDANASPSPSNSSGTLPEGDSSNPNGTVAATSPTLGLSSQISKIAIEKSLIKMDLKPPDFEVLADLGHGNGGTVKKVLHKPTNTIMAKKAIFIDTAPGTREFELIKKQILRELSILHSCESKYIVSFYGAFVNEGEISICMEYMDLGSLDSIYRKLGIISEEIIGQITVAVLEGLVYLYQNHRIIHRDVKPSNILFNSRGEIKICDFGVSGEAINSVANTFVGTSSYMSPERIQGGKYSAQSDVWSLGITLMELALGKFPFPADNESGSGHGGDGGEGKNMAVFELLQYIVHEEVPKLPEGKGSKEFEDFLSKCLIKEPLKRPTPSQLMRHEFVKKSQTASVDLKKWAMSIKELINLKL